MTPGMLRGWWAAIAKGLQLRGIDPRAEVEFAELVEEPPRPLPGPTRQVVVQAHELQRPCRGCGTFHDAQGPVVEAPR